MASSSVLDGGDGVMVVATAVVLSKRRESSGRGSGTWVLWDVVEEDGFMGGAVVLVATAVMGWVISVR